jgi:hypothetical protein
MGVMDASYTNTAFTDQYELRLLTNPTIVPPAST